MSLSLDPSLRSLDDCGCCDGLSVATPVTIDNRPGLTALAYRVGTHASFKQSMLARLSSELHQPLHALNTRDDDDFTIALLDAWSAVGDVLTFYQERIANESYLRTATERLSLAHLARLIGYEPRPGVAGGTYLAFTLEDGPGSPESIPIGAGVKVQSIPGPGELPQTYETMETIEAQPEWNAMRPRLIRTQPLSATANYLIVKGTATNLRPGDSVLIVESDDSNVSGPNPPVKRVVRAVPDPKTQTTRIDLSPLPPPQQVFHHVFPLPPRVKTFKVVQRVPMRRDRISELVYRGKRWLQGDLRAFSRRQRWRYRTVIRTIRVVQERERNVPPEDRVATPKKGLFAFRQRAAIFGHNAPHYDTVPVAIAGKVTPNVDPQDPKLFASWEDWKLSQDAFYIDKTNAKAIDLDLTYPNIVSQSWVVLQSLGATRVYQVDAYRETSRVNYTLNAKVGRVLLNSDDDLDKFTVRETTVLAQSEELMLADLPVTTPIQGDSILLDRGYADLKSGQTVIVTGEIEDLDGIIGNEVMTLKEVELDEGYTRLSFTRSLVNIYVARTVTINGNVAYATHGETREQVLGSGDAGQSFQRFLLRHTPLTYLSSSNPRGATSTIEVRVDGVRWREVPTLYGHGPDERVYIVRTDDQGRTTVEFGDGRTGARLPTGRENVHAHYRQGAGLPGLVKKDQLSLLATRPLGVRGVTNPLAAEGAAEAEQRDETRRNAPLTVLTLDRIVSLRDYEDFARAFAGIAKALAIWAWGSAEQGVMVTVAGPAGLEVEDTPTNPVFSNLLAAMRAAGDPFVPLELKSYEPRSFLIDAQVKIHPDYLADVVLAAVEAALQQRFSFEARAFGQPVSGSEVVAVIQSLPGVIAVDLNALYLVGDDAALNATLTAALPRWTSTGETLAAELLTLDDRPLRPLYLREML